MKKLTIFEGNSLKKSGEKLINLLQPIRWLEELTFCLHSSNEITKTEKMFENLKLVCERLLPTNGKLKRIMFRCNGSSMTISDIA